MLYIWSIKYVAKENTTSTIIEHSDYTTRLRPLVFLNLYSIAVIIIRQEKCACGSIDFLFPHILAKLLCKIALLQRCVYICVHLLVNKFPPCVNFWMSEITVTEFCWAQFAWWNDSRSIIDTIEPTSKITVSI